ncbi:MAG: hypothetical protein LBD17_05470 [Endomicrobium sp.]|jgi:transposase-like protein|nr:hypothetical protein [Endomicrobium sp.]
MEKMRNCPRCKSEKSVKHGILKGLQRYKCKGCGCDYTKSRKYGYSLEERKKAIKYYLEEIGFRKIERLLAISNVTVLYWVRELGRKLFLEKICNNKSRYVRA